MSEPFISVIVPAFNEERNIERCLHALLEQDYRKDRYEVLVVDNGSRDRTRQLALELGVQVIEIPRSTVSVARNIGAQHAQGSILGFVDADCVAASNWLRVAATLVGEHPRLAGSYYHLPPDESWIAKTWSYLREASTDRFVALSGGNIVVPRGVFLGIGGFDESLATGEDAEFSRRAFDKHVPLLYAPELQVTHLGEPKTLEHFVRRETWYGLGAFGTFRQHWFDRPLLGTFAFIVGHILVFAGALFGKSSLLVIACFGILGLLVASIFHRRSTLRGVGHILRLLLLFYLFYLGRAASLFLLLRRVPYYHNMK